MSETQAKLTAAAEALQSVARPLIQALSIAVPYIIAASSKAYSIYKTLPKNAILFLTGFIFCFFGGLYPVTFAAVQAAEHGGRENFIEALQDLSEEAIVIIEGEFSKRPVTDYEGSFNFLCRLTSIIYHESGRTKKSLQERRQGRH